MRGKNWTKEEDAFLVERWGTVKNKRFLASLMNRSVEGISKRARKLKLGPFLNATDDMTYGELARVLGLYGSYHWYKQKLIKAGLPVYQKQINQKKVTKVKFKKFWGWAAKHKELIDWTKLEKGILGAEPYWVDEQRRKDFKHRPVFTKKWTQTEHENLIYYINKGLSMDEIAKKLNRSAGAVERRCYDYYLQRPKLESQQRWSQEEIEEVMLLRSQGWNYRNIADKTGRSERSVRGKIYDITHRKGKQWIVFCKKSDTASFVAM